MIRSVGKMMLSLVKCFKLFENILQHALEPAGYGQQMPWIKDVQDNTELPDNSAQRSSRSTGAQFTTIDNNLQTIRL